MIPRIPLFLWSRVRSICVLMLVLVLASGCPTPTPLPPTPDPTTWPTWTFMVFLNGDNNLDSAAVDDFNEMAQVGSDGRLNIVAQLDRRGNGTTKRYLIGKNDTVNSNPVQTLGEQNMGDPKVFADFIVWAEQNYPADHYLLVIWDHGDGWRSEQQKIAQAEANLRSKGAVAELGMKAVSHDETDDDVLYTHEVDHALRRAVDQTGTKLDIVGFDACLMGMIEVAYEIRGSADFMVGSEETEPRDGWPYDTILTDLSTSFAARTPRNLAKIIVQRYGESYGSNGDQTQAAYDLHQISAVTDAISAFVTTHNSLSQADKEWSQVGAARSNTEEFHDKCVEFSKCWGVDIGDFAKETAGRVGNADVQEALVGLAFSTTTKFVIANYHGSDHPDAFGVAVYFPLNKHTYLADGDHNGYEDANTDNPVAFVQDFKWDNWLREQYSPQFP